MTMDTSRLISPPDGNVLETLTDSRVISTAFGAAIGAFGEKQLWISQRETFGIASLEKGKMKFYAQDPATKKASKEAPELGTNRQLARFGIVVACVAGIESVPDGNIQYALLGAAAVAMSHMIQDLIPAIK